MILLENLTEKEKVNISIQCEPKFLVAHKTRAFNKVFKKVKEDCFPRTNRNNEELWLVLTCLLKSLRYGTRGTRFSLDNNLYSIANKIHGQKLSAKRASNVIEVMESQGYLDYYKGYFFSEKNRMTSCIFSTEKFIDLLDMNVVRRYAAKRDPLSYIEVKDANDKTVLLSLQDFKGYSTQVKRIESYNNLLGNSCITVQDNNERVVCSVAYKRVFSGDLDHAGRFYSYGTFQTKESSTRTSILINGHEVTEVDYANLHPRLLYTLEGVTLKDSWDAYAIDGLEWINSDSKVRRGFLKKAYLSILFSEDEKQATKSVLSEANKMKDILISKAKDAAKVVESILNKNSKIRHWFFKERLWAKLQYMDSRLASYVIYTFTEDKEVCLGWHDSFVVAKYNQLKLIEYMRDAWYSLFGSYNNFKIDIEF